MVDPFGNHKGTGADDFAVAPYLDKAYFGGTDLGLHAGQRKRRADRLALALLKRSKPRLKLVTAGKRLAFLAGQLVEALRQPSISRLWARVRASWLVFSSRSRQAVSRRRAFAVPPS